MASSGAAAAKPAKVQDFDEDTGMPIPGTTKTAGHSDKGSGVEHGSVDLHSDSGYSSTLLSAASADNAGGSAATTPKAKAPVRETTSATATPTPTQGPSAVRPERASSPTKKKHHRSSSKSSKQSAMTTQSAPVPHPGGWYYPPPAGQLEGYFPPHPGYDPAYDPAYAPQYYHPAFHPPSGRHAPVDAPFDPARPPPPLSNVWGRRASYYKPGYAPSPYSHHPPYATNPEHPSSPMDPYYPDQLIDRHYPSTREAQITSVSSRPALPHYHSDSKAYRRRSYIDAYAPTFAEDGFDLEFAPSRSRSSRRHRSSKGSDYPSPTEEWMRHPHLDSFAKDWTNGPSSTRHARVDVSKSGTAKLSRGTPVLHDDRDDRLQPTTRTSHRHSLSMSNRPSPSYELPTRSRSRRHSVSPAGEYFAVPESRSSRRTDVSGGEESLRRERRRSRVGDGMPVQDVKDTLNANLNTAEEYMTQLNGGVPTTDQFFSDLRRTGSHHTRPAAIERGAASVSSRQSGRSHSNRPDRRQPSVDASSTTSARILRVVNQRTGVSRGMFIDDDEVVSTYRVENVHAVEAPISPTEERWGRTSRKSSGQSDREDKGRRRSSRSGHDHHDADPYKDRERSDRDRGSRERGSERAHSRASSFRNFFSRNSSRSRASSEVGTESRAHRRLSQMGSPIPEEGDSGWGERPNDRKDRQR